MIQKNKLFRYVLSFCLAICLLSNLVSASVQAHAITFPDVPSNHFATEAIDWAYAEGIISGYANGLFGPNDEVTEEQFAKMIVQYFGLEAAKGRLSPEKARMIWTSQPLLNQADLDKGWSAGYYNQLASYGVPLNGYFLPQVRSKAVKRGTVAQALAYLLVDKMDLKASISLLHKHDITKWARPDEYTLPTKFGYLDNLTRAQAVTFLHRLHQQGMKQISEVAQLTYTDYDAAVTEFNELALDGKYMIDGRLQSASGVHSQSYTEQRAYIDYEEIERQELVESWIHAQIPIEEGKASSLEQAKHIDLHAINYFAELMSTKTEKLLHQVNFKVTASSTDSIAADSIFGPFKDVRMVRLTREDGSHFMLSYVPNYISPELYGGREYRILGKQQVTDTEMEFYASLLTDLSGVDISAATLKKIPEWSRDGINISDDYGSEGHFGAKGTTVKLGHHVYVTPLGNELNTNIFIDKLKK